MGRIKSFSIVSPGVGSSSSPLRQLLAATPPVYLNCQVSTKYHAAGMFCACFPCPGIVGKTTQSSAMAMESSFYYCVLGGFLFLFFFFFFFPFCIFVFLLILFLITLLFVSLGSEPYNSRCLSYCICLVHLQHRVDTISFFFTLL